jgi:hypothetical protein
MQYHTNFSSYSLTSNASRAMSIESLFGLKKGFFESDFY